MSLTPPPRAAVRRTHDAAAHEALVEQLDQQVRELVRRDGVDPQRDAALVRRLATSVVRDHDERSLTGRVTPVPDVEAMVGELVARVSGFGPLQPFLDDPAVEEIWINDPSRVFIARNGRHELTTLVLTAAQVQELVERMLKSSGRRGISGFRIKKIAKRRDRRPRSGFFRLSVLRHACPARCNAVSGVEKPSRRPTYHSAGRRNKMWAQRIAPSGRCWGWMVVTRVRYCAPVEGGGLLRGRVESPGSAVA